MTRMLARHAVTGALLATLAATGVLAQTTELTVALPNPSAVNNYPVHVAIGEGYFAEEGLSVTVEALNGSASVLQAMASGQAQIGNPGPGPVLAANGRGEPIVFVYNQCPISLFGLVVPADSPIQSPAELKGAIIGVGTADGAEVTFTTAIMADLGLVAGRDFEFLTVGESGTAAVALMNKEVTAFAAAVVDMAIIESRGFALREITPEPYLGYFGNGWAVTRAYLDANPTIVEGFGRAIARATVFALDPANEARVLDHAAAGNPQEGEDRAFAATLFKAIQARMTPTDRTRPWGYQPPEDWQRWHDSQVATGNLPAPLPDLSAVYTNRFVEAWNKDL